MSSPNILLVILDSVRAQNTSLHGYGSETTPFLDQFAENATVYREARAPGVNTMMSLTSMFTGYHVPEHGLTHRGLSLESGHTIWEELDERGYQTAVFSRNTNLIDLPIGLNDAFTEVYSGRQERLPFSEALDPSEYHSDTGKDISGFIKSGIASGRPIRSVLNGIALMSNNNGNETRLPDWLSVRYDDSIHTQQLLEWVRSEEGPWAACVNYMDAHIPYQPRNEHNLFTNDSEPADGDTGGSKWEFFSGTRSFEELEWLERLYDGTIHQVDAEVRRLIEGLREHDEYQNTLIVIAGDHGDAFGERSQLRDCRCVHHGITGRLHETVLHVPLLVKWPRQNSGETISDVATLTRFPDAVRSVIEGDWNECEFSTDEYVLAYSPEIDRLEREQARKYEVDDLSSFEKPMKAVYERFNETIVAHILWDDNTISHLSENNCNVKKRKLNPDYIVNNIHSKLYKRNITHNIETGVDQNIKDRLKKLGYV